MEELLALVEGAPHRSLAAGEVLLVDGESVPDLFVLVAGALRIEKGGTAITTVTAPGACVGEMSLLLGVPVTANVIASEPSEVAVIEDAATMLDTDPRLALGLARLLASRLQVMTTYLVDIRRQYADHEGGLGMVDVVLDQLMRGPGARSRLGSHRDPEPEY